MLPVSGDSESFAMYVASSVDEIRNWCLKAEEVHNTWIWSKVMLTAHRLPTEHSAAWVVLLPQGWRSPPSCLQCPMTQSCSSVADTGTTASEWHPLRKANWWDSTSGTWVSHSLLGNGKGLCVIWCSQNTATSLGHTVVKGRQHKNRRIQEECLNCDYTELPEHGFSVIGVVLWCSFKIRLACYF